MKTLQKLSTSPPMHKVDDNAIREVISYIMDAPPSEWLSNRVVHNSHPIIAGKFEFVKHHQKNFGMALYVEACKKYKIQATDYIGQILNQVVIDRWLDRSHKYSHHYQYRDEYYRPMMYKLNELNK